MINLTWKKDLSLTNIVTYVFYKIKRNTHYFRIEILIAISSAHYFMEICFFHWVWFPCVLKNVLTWVTRNNFSSLYFIKESLSYDFLRFTDLRSVLFLFQHFKNVVPLFSSSNIFYWEIYSHSYKFLYIMFLLYFSLTNCHVFRSGHFYI